MDSSQEERRHRREQFRKMTVGQKLEHLWMYYKVPFLVGILVLVLLIGGIRDLLTAKGPVLYVAEMNVAFEEDTRRTLCEGYLSARGLDPQKQEVFYYQNLYLSQDPSPEKQEMVYTTQMKLLGAVNAGQMDLILMGKEGYDQCSANGLLLDLTAIIPEGDALCPYLTENAVLSEDDSPDALPDGEGNYPTVTEYVCNGLDVSSFPIFEGTGHSESVYLGVIANTRRADTCRDYMDYLRTWVSGA